MLDTATVGSRLRIARKQSGRSLADVAGEAGMSVSTLSRIETDKQSIELETLISLCGILSIDPAGLMSSEASGPDTIDPILSRLKVLDREERLQFWQQLTEATRDMATNEGIKTRDLAMEVEELLAQLDFLRAEIEAVKQRIRK